MAADPIITADQCSVWYGQVLGLSDVSWSASAGVVGLLGPNGAGKSTLMRLLVGLLSPSRGSVEVFGEQPWNSPDVRRRIGYCPEHENLYNELTALEFVTAMAQLSGMGPKAKKAAEEALDRLGMSDARNRRLRGFSKGMKQRTKLAQCIVHDPELLILDEPMTGVDPLARSSISKLITELGAEGKSIVMSSHVLFEVESITKEIVLLYQGQVLAEGNVYKIRELIDAHPHRIRIECSSPRILAKSLLDLESTTNIHFERNGFFVETRDPDACYDLIRDVALRDEIAIRALSSPDNNLGAVFEYLTGGSR